MTRGSETRRYLEWMCWTPHGVIHAGYEPSCQLLFAELSSDSGTFLRYACECGQCRVGAFYARDRAYYKLLENAGVSGPIPEPTWEQLTTPPAQTTALLRGGNDEREGDHTTRLAAD